MENTSTAKKINTNSIKDFFERKARDIDFGDTIKFLNNDEKL